jgi:hypothetical protein
MPTPPVPVSIIISGPVPGLYFRPAVAIYRPELILIKLAIWATRHPAKLSELDLALRNPLLMRLMVEHQIFHRVNVNDHLENLTMFDIAWPNELKLGINPGITLPIS